MIQTVKDLNKFVASSGIKSHRLLIPALVENKVIVSSGVAALILGNRNQQGQQLDSVFSGCQQI